MKISVIGCGNMAGAIMGGMIKNGLVSPEEVTASDVFEPARQRVREGSACSLDHGGQIDRRSGKRSGI